MNRLQSVKGMHDVLPEDILLWHYVETTYKTLVSLYGYQEIRTPILEQTSLFSRGIGDSTDIVEKEMYSFVDKGGEDLTLRPEGTASVIRAYLQHKVDASGGVKKFYYLGPMFRRERPAKGRFRQFYQAGAELIGANEPLADAELISMAFSFVKKLGIKEPKVILNSLGDADARPAFILALRNYYAAHIKSLCADCLRRIEKNPLRLLDCKVLGCEELKAGAPSILEFLNNDQKQHFDNLQEALELFGVSYAIDPHMVRGLDYYTQTIFEIKAGNEILGSQSTIVGGGRYNGLVTQLGGRQTPTVGFAFGIERLILLLEKNSIAKSSPVIFVCGIGEGALNRSVKISAFLRDASFRVETPYKEASLRAQMKKADKSGASICIIAGEDEAAQDSVTIRILSTGEQQIVSLKDLASRLEELL